MEFDSSAISILNQLNTAGYEAYFVGGCVRDYLRNVAPHDYDVATSALPEEILAVFAGVPVVGTGRKHGTVTVLWQGISVEVTTFRVDGEYADGRHPEEVRFTRSLREDLARRDFTVNAMAWSPDGGIVDPFGGREDLARGILRCVGDPDRRFEEDGLRVLRGLRFASVLGLCPEPFTEGALRRKKDRLSLVSAERIREELGKLLCGAKVSSVLLSYPEVLGVWLPELLPCVAFDQHNFHHAYDLYTHLARTVEGVPPVPRLRMGALLHDIGKPPTFSLDGDGVGHFYGHASRSAEMADEILRRLRYSTEDRKAVMDLIRYHDTPIEPTQRALRRKLNQLGPQGVFDLIALMRADNLALASEFHGRQGIYDTLTVMTKEILEEKQCFSRKDLKVNGRDLSVLGYEGKAVGEALKVLLEAVLDGRCPNEPQALLDFLSVWERENLPSSHS